MSPLLAELPQFSFAPRIPACFLVLGIAVAVILSVILYREQRRIASLGMVLLLMALRALLIVLLAILFLQPALRWTSSRSHSGTLWIVLDQSPSMQTTDPQATPAERLHWAEGIGMLPGTSPQEALAVRASILSQQFTAIVPPLSSTAGPSDRAAIADFADKLDALRKDVQQLKDDVGGTSYDATDYLKRTADNLEKIVPAVRSAQTMREALGFRRDFIDDYLRQAADILRKSADSADNVALASRKGASDLQAADKQLQGITRAQLAYQTLTASDSPGAKTLRDLAQQYNLRIATFSDKVEPASLASGSALPDVMKGMLTTSGQATSLSSALQFVSEQVASDEAASVVLVTDGRHNIGPDPGGVARNLAARGIHVFGLLAGSHALAPDAAVEPVDFPDWVYIGDSIKPRALVRLDGLKGQDAFVELRRDGMMIDQRQVHAATAHDMIPFDFTDKPPDAGADKVLQYEIRVTPFPGEVNTQNNVAMFRVAIKKDKLNALIVEDRPRWEFRYLAAYLSQRQGYKLQTVLLQPAPIAGVASPPLTMASPDNPRTEANRLPDTIEGWEKFDIIVLGDVSPEVVTPDSQNFILQAVRDRGACLITISGQRFMPAAYANMPLADLLPVTLEPQWSSDDITRHLRLGFHPNASPTAGTSPLAMLASESSASARAWMNMPDWYWHSPYTAIKPAASAVWTINDVNPGAISGGAEGVLGAVADANRHALMSTMTVGLGHVLHLASDQSWRMRQIAGDNAHDRFWGQVLNWAVGSDLPAGGRFVRFGTSQPTYEQSRPVVVTARVLRDDLTPYTGLSFQAVARPARRSTGAPVGEVTANFSPMDTPGYYQATLTGLPIGDVEVSLRGSEVERLLDTDPTVTLKTILLKIFPTLNAERQNMNTAPDMLQRIAQNGAGISVDIDHADLLLSRMPRIEHKETTIYQLGFFTDPDAEGTRRAHWGFLLAFALVITAEWALRKRAGLV